MGYKWTLNGGAFSCTNTRVNHNELRFMFGFLVPTYSSDTCLSNCMVSHPSRANMSLQWEAQISTTSRQQHLLTCSQTPWQSNSHIQQLGKGKTIPLQAWTGPEVSRRLRLPDFKTIGTWKWYSCQPYAPAAFTTGNSAAGRIMSMKNSNDTIRNRICDLPACSAVPQPNAPLHAPI